MILQLTGNFSSSLFFGDGCRNVGTLDIRLDPAGLDSGPGCVGQSGFCWSLTSSIGTEPVWGMKQV